MTLRQNIRRALTEVQTFRLPQPQRAQGVSRPAWMRLQNLLAILRTGEQFNANTISRLLKLSSKTIQRDLKFLRHQGVKIVYEHGPQTYTLDKSFPLPPQFCFPHSCNPNPTTETK